MSSSLSLCLSLLFIAHFYFFPCSGYLVLPASSWQAPASGLLNSPLEQRQNEWKEQNEIINNQGSGLQTFQIQGVKGK
jgi:hypothetical protein